MRAPPVRSLRRGCEGEGQGLGEDVGNGEGIGIGEGWRGTDGRDPVGVVGGRSERNRIIQRRFFEHCLRRLCSYVCHALRHKIAQETSAGFQASANKGPQGVVSCVSMLFARLSSRVWVSGQQDVCV